MSGEWKRDTARLVRHRQTKGPETDRPNLPDRATPRLNLSAIPTPTRSRPERVRPAIVQRRLSRPETHLQWDDCRRMTSGVNERHRSVTQPRDRGAALVQFRLAQDRVVAPFVEAHQNAVGLHFHLAAGLDELAVHFLRGGL